MVVSLLLVVTSVLLSTENKKSGKSFSMSNSGSMSAMLFLCLNFPRKGESFMYLESPV